MTLVITERPRLSGGHNRRGVTYYVRDDGGADLTPETAVDAVITAAPATYYGFPLVDYDYDELATDRYDVTLIYAPRSLQITRPEPAVGSAQYSFATTLETVHIRTSLATVSSYADASQLPAGVTGAYNFQNAINVDPEGRVQGTTIQVPVTRFKYRYRVPGNLMTFAYQEVLEDLAGYVNSIPFKGRAAGTTRFDGATGGTRAEGDWDLDFNFTKRPNISNQTIGAITGVAADGWDLIWPYFVSRSTGDRGFSAPSPAYVYVERIYPRANLNVLNIPG